MALILIIAALFIAAPASTGTKYLSGDPIITVAISGTNEFSPGDEVTIPIVIQNSGLKEMKITSSDIVDRDDNPDTAKMVTVDLLKNDAPGYCKIRSPDDWGYCGRIQYNRQFYC